jgi:hypothetical protein
MGRLVHKHRQPCYCDRVDEFFASRGGPSLDSTRSSVLSPNTRSFTSVVLSLGLLSTLYPISASGSFNLARSQLSRNNGSAPSWFYFRISPLNCQWYVPPRLASPHMDQMSNAILDMVVPPTCRSHRNGYIPGPFTIVANNASSSRVFLLFRGHVSLLLYIHIIVIPEP